MINIVPVLILCALAWWFFRRKGSAQGASLQKKLLIFAVLLALGFVLNAVNKPMTPEEQVRQEEARKQDTARKAYFAHPVIRGREVARKLEAINEENTAPIAEAMQSIQANAASKGQQPVNVRAVANASLAFDSMAKAYADFNVPQDLPDKSPALLTGARVRLKQSAEAGTEAFLELQRLLEGKGKASMKSVNASLEKATQLRNEGVQWLENAKKELAGMAAPEWVK